MLPGTVLLLSINKKRAQNRYLSPQLQNFCQFVIPLGESPPRRIAVVNRTNRRGGGGGGGIGANGPNGVQQ